MAAKTIVLAHGVLGFGNLAGLPGFVQYFQDVAEHLRDQGHTVISPQVNPIGSVVSRGNRFAMELLKQTQPDHRVHILAHSMGGLDARHAITNVQRRW
jgi:triacylglycerol lipase